MRAVPMIAVTGHDSPITALAETSRSGKCRNSPTVAR